MSDFLSDNDDLRFYIEHAIDWERLFVEASQLDGDDSPYADLAEARETWTDMLQLVATFSAEQVAPFAAELDTEGMALEDGEVTMGPRLQGIFDQLADLGLHGMCLPTAVGGLGSPMMLYFLSSELVARGDVSVMAHMGFHGGVAMAMMMYSAMEGSTEVDLEARKLVSTRFQAEVEEILTGKAWGSMDITEPDAGSDMGALRSTGRQLEDGSWVVTGQKIFITSGHGRWHFVIARTEEARASEDPMAGLDGLSLFLVEAYRDDEDGQRQRFSTLERLEEKLGHHASATVTISFEDSPARLVGKRGEGFKMMLLLMNNARISVGFEAIGLAEAAVRAARSYAAVRRSMGKTIDRHEIIADYLEEMETDIRGLRALAVDAAFNEEVSQRAQIRLKYMPPEDAAEKASLETEVRRLKRRSRMATPLLKFMAAEKAVEITRRALQIHGGSGYMTEYPVEKLLRDALVLPIYEGTSQIQALMATKDALLGILQRPQAFARRYAEVQWSRRVALDPTARRVAELRANAMSAQVYLIRWIVQGKLHHVPVTRWATELKDWDTKVDFAPALLHAERLAWLLGELAVVERLEAQARTWPERRVWLDRTLERALPRSRFHLDCIRTTGQRILDQLARGEDSEASEAAK